MGRDNQTCEIGRKIGLIWVTFGKLNYILKSNIPICQKKRIDSQCVLSVLSYAAETLTLTKSDTEKHGKSDIGFLSER